MWDKGMGVKREQCEEFKASFKDVKTASPPQGRDSAGWWTELTDVILLLITYVLYLSIQE